MKDIKHFRRDFYLAAWVMPQRWNLGGTVWGWEDHFFQKFNHIWCVSYLHEWHMQRHHFGGLTPWGLGEGPKGQISFHLNYKVNFKDFHPNFCDSSHKWKMYYISDGIFFIPPWVMLRGGTWGYHGGWGIKFFPEIQSDLVCELLTWIALAPAQFFGSPHQGPWGGVKNLIFWT